MQLRSREIPPPLITFRNPLQQRKPSQRQPSNMRPEQPPFCQHPTQKPWQRKGNMVLQRSLATSIHLRKAVVMTKRRKPPTFLRILKERNHFPTNPMRRVKPSNQRMVLRRQPKLPSPPMHPVITHHERRPIHQLHPQRLLHQRNVRRKQKDALDWSTYEGGFTYKCHL
jgi:hypothetical protein